jgi:sugar/nucleoside kinase (ribokinase family)
MWTIVTAGAKGSWAWNGVHLTHLPACEVKAISAAGAGDAFFAGVLTGLASGLSLEEAQQLGGLTGALSVTSPHTIHPDMDRVSLAAFARIQQVKLSPSVMRILGVGP